MFLISFLSSLALSANVCLYKSHKDLCNESHIPISFEELSSKFIESLVPKNDTTLNVYVVENHLAKYEIPINNIKARRLAFYSSKQYTEIYINFDLCRNTTFYAITDFSVKGITSDIKVPLIEFKDCIFPDAKDPIGIHAQNLGIDIPTSQAFAFVNASNKIEFFFRDIQQLNQSHYLRMYCTKSSRNFIRMIMMENETSANLLGDDIYFMKVNNPDIKYHIICMNDIPSFHIYTKDGIHLYMNCYARGPHYHNIGFTVFLDKSTVIFPKSLWPETTTEIINIYRLGPATIIMAQYRLPARIRYSPNPLTLIANASVCGIYNSLNAVGDSITVKALDPNMKCTMVIEKLVSSRSNTTIHNESPNLEFFMRSIDTPAGLHHNFLGAGTYCLKKFPDQKVYLHFSELRIQREQFVYFPFDLNGSALITVERSVSMTKGTFIPYLNNGEIETAADIEAHYGTVYEFMCAPNLNADHFDIQFDSYNINRGFSRGVSVFEKVSYEKDNNKCVGMKMSKYYSNISYQFCINPKNKKFVCDDEVISITDPKQFQEWQKYAGADVPLLEFRVVDEMVDSDNKPMVYDFSKFTAPDLALIFTSNSQNYTRILLDSKVLSRGLQYVSFAGVEVTVDKDWNHQINTSLFMRDSKLTTDAAYTIMDGPFEVTADESSYATLKTIFPSKLNLNTDSFNQATYSINKISMSCPDCQNISIPIVKRKPSVSFKISNDFAVVNEDSTQTNSASLVIDSFGSNTLSIKGKFDPESHNIEIGQFEDGIIQTDDDLIPVTSKSTGFTAKSSSNTMNFPGYLNLNNKVAFLPKTSEGIVSIGEASFGPKTNINESTFKSYSIKKVNFLGPNLHNHNSMHVSKSFTMEMGGSARIDEFSYDEGVEFNLTWVPGILPYAVLDMPNSQSQTKAKLNLILTDYFNDFHTMNESVKYFNNVSLEIVCGKNLACEYWDRKFIVPGKANQTIPFEFQCKKSFNDRTCIMIHAAYGDNNDDNDDNNDDNDDNNDDNNDDDNNDDDNDDSHKSKLSKTAIILIATFSSIAGISLIVTLSVLLTIYIKKKRIEKKDTLTNSLLGGQDV